MDPNDPRFRDQFGRLNVDAPSFIPNAHAPPFVPYPYVPQHGGMYNMPPPGPMGQYGGYPQFPPGGRGYPGYQHQRHHQHHPPPNQQHYPPRYPEGNPPMHYQQQSVLPTQRTTQDSTSQGKQSTGEPETTAAQDPVDSWEDIAENPPVDTSSSTDKSILSDAPLKTGDKDTTTTTTKTTTTTTSRKEDNGENVKENQDRETTADPQQPKAAPEKKKKEKVKSSEPSSKSSESTASKVKEALHPVKDTKENMNIIFIGHVDAGKSTIGGQLMYLTGQVDKRTLEKFEREAKSKNRETWYLSWALDLNPEEREKGKTVEVGRAYFETEKKRFHILDAPGHAGFVPNMIGGAAQADIAILVISARRGEFETGFEKGGQTREHTVLVKTAGAKHLIVLINKMDDPTVEWSENRYEECKVKLLPFLKKVGFNPNRDIHIMPVSGYLGTNLKDTDQNVCPFYTGPSFLDYLDGLGPLNREDTGPVRLPILDRFKDMGTFVIGKLEAGTLVKGQTLVMMPNKVQVEVLSVCRNEQEIQKGFCGDNLKIKLKGIEEEEISSGFVLCPPDNYCHVGKIFDAQIHILESKSIICAGYSAVMHIHTLVEEVQLKALIAIVDRKTGKKTQSRPRFVTQSQDKGVIARFETAGIICMEAFKDFPQMARFTLRDEGRTVAIGKILKVVE